MGKIRILLADDHETIREGLKAILASEADFEIVAEASDGEAAVEAAKTLHPDVVIMDVSMPVLNGLQATESIKQTCPDARVLVLTRHSDEGYLHQLLRAGASGYVLKQSRANTVVGAVRALVEGRNYLDPAITSKVVGRQRERQPYSPVASLSPREEEVLRMVAWGYSNKDIATKLDLSVKTVETHKANATQKLNLPSRSDVVRFALLQGWLQDT